MMAIVYTARHRLLGAAHALSWFPPLLARVSVGLVFAETGWGKLQNLDRVIGYFGSLGIPLPEIQAPMVAAFELGCGILLVAGLLTRLASLPLVAIMGIALLTAKADDIASLTDLFFLPEYLVLLALVWLAIAGPGAVSLDRLAAHRGLPPWAGPAASGRAAD